MWGVRPLASTPFGAEKISWKRAPGASNTAFVEQVLCGAESTRIRLIDDVRDSTSGEEASSTRESKDSACVRAMRSASARHAGNSRRSAPICTPASRTTHSWLSGIPSEVHADVRENVCVCVAAPFPAPLPRLWLSSTCKLADAPTGGRLHSIPARLR